MKIIKYKDLKYTTFFDEKNGFFARVEDKDTKEPFWAPHGPELIDISITNWCDRNCSFCYRKADTNGTHMDYNNYCKIIDKAKSINVFQVALGGGNPNQHPDFLKILQYTREAGIVPNYTTNGRGLTEDILVYSKKYCGAVAVSAYEPYDEMEEAIIKLHTKGIKTNIHFLLDSASIYTALQWLKKPPLILQKINAIIFLNYKPIGRVISSEKLLNQSNLLDEFYTFATSHTFPFKIGFDACSVSALFSRTNYNEVTIEGCDAARFSMFISEDMKAYPCSFYKEQDSGDKINSSGDFIDIWLNSQKFKAVRSHFASNSCQNCPYNKVCLNGCPLFDDINLC